MSGNSKSDLIKFLVERKFPDYRALRIPPSLTSGGRGGISWEYRDKRLKKIGAYEAELTAKPLEDLRSLFENEKNKYHQELAQKVEKQEQERFFNKPSAKADYEYWSKAAHWTLDEATALVLGKAPEQVTWKKVEPYINISSFAKRYARVRDLARRAKTWNQLFDPVLPGIFLAWANRIEIDIPHELAEQIKKRGSWLQTGRTCMTS